jgi:hypothetical protein
LLQDAGLETLGPLATQPDGGPGARHAAFDHQLRYPGAEEMINQAAAIQELKIKVSSFWPIESRIG